jgi:hypothetical protein
VANRGASTATWDPTDIPDFTEYAVNYHPYGAFDVNFRNEGWSQLIEATFRELVTAWRY